MVDLQSVYDFSIYCEFSPGITDIVDLVTLGNPLSNKPPDTATLLDSRYEGKLVSPNLTKRHLSKDENSLNLITL